MKILIVDDSSEKIAKLVTVIQEFSETFSLETVTDCISAKRELEKKKFDLIIVDLLLPLRPDTPPVEHGGQTLVKEIYRLPQLISPTLIVGFTQYGDYVSNFSSAWKVLLFEDSSWDEELKEILAHLFKVKSNERIPSFKEQKKNSLIVEGETDAIILKLALKLFFPDSLSKIEIKYQKGGGANWVANQIVAWAFAQEKDDDAKWIKCIGLLDGDNAGKEAQNEINRVVKSSSESKNSFKVIKLNANFAKDTISLFKKRIPISITLEEMYSKVFWHEANQKGWLEDRSFENDPQDWDKRSQSLNQFFQTKELTKDEMVYLRQFTLQGKVEAVKEIGKLDDEKQRHILKNIELLLKEVISFLFDEKN